MRAACLAQAFVAGATVLAAAPAAATIMVPLTLEQMAEESVAVVRARVVSRQATWGPRHKHIFTYNELEVIEAIHGPHAHGARIVVRTLGGEVDGTGMRVSGTPRFSVDEEVVLFLRDDPVRKGDFQVIGMSQGKYQVKRESSGRAILLPGLEGIAFARPSATGTLRVDPNAPGPGQVSLVDFRRRVAAARGQDVPKAPDATKGPASPVPVPQ